MSLEWVPRALGKGRVTTAYPRRAEEPPAGFRGRVDVLDSTGGDRSPQAPLPDRRDQCERSRRRSARQGALHPLRGMRRKGAEALRVPRDL